MKLTFDELLDDSKFVAWIVRGDRKLEWESFLVEHPEFRFKVSKVQKILDLLRERPENLSEGELLRVWKNIESYDNTIRDRSRQFKFRSILQYAAILILILFIGSGGFWLFDKHQNSYTYTSKIDPRVGNQSRLLLSNGTSVDLEKKNSTIAMNSGEKIVIDNEKIINLDQAVGSDDSKMNEVVIPFGKKSQLILEDGTKVWLNAGSRMAFPTKFRGKKREVFLEGEAYFEVAHSKEHPFLVNTSDLSIKVLGTRFNVSAYDSDQVTETVLLEGKVSVSELSVLGMLKSETILSPNQKASYNHIDGSITVKSEADVEFAIAWTEGWFKFSQQSLQGVINKLQRFYNVQFVFDAEFSTADLISGKLDLKESVYEVMIALSDVANIQYRVVGNKIYINKRISELLMRK